MDSYKATPEDQERITDMLGTLEKGPGDPEVMEKIERGAETAEDRAYLVALSVTGVAEKGTESAVRVFESSYNIYDFARQYGMEHGLTPMELLVGLDFSVTMLAKNIREVLDEKIAQSATADSQAAI